MKKILLLLLAAPLLFSCEDYLERTQKSDLDEEQIFGSYQNFTGFIDNLYGKKLVRYIDQANCACLDMGDDVYGSKDFIASQTFPQGNYWWIWTNTWQNMITESSSGGNYGFWNGWEQIRICNQGFKNLHLLVGATDEQVRLIKGQLHFFRVPFRTCPPLGRASLYRPFFGAERQHALSATVVQGDASAYYRRSERGCGVSARRLESDPAGDCSSRRLSGACDPGRGACAQSASLSLCCESAYDPHRKRGG